MKIKINKNHTIERTQSQTSTATFESKIVELEVGTLNIHNIFKLLKKIYM